MPVVKIWGVPRFLYTREPALFGEIRVQLQQTIASVAEMEIQPAWVKVFYPVDTEQSGDQLIVEIIQNDTVNRTDELNTHVANLVREVIVTRLVPKVPQCHTVEVLIFPFLERRGFSVWNKKT